MLSRLVTIVAAAGTIVALYRAGREAFGTRAAVFAAAALTVLTPFLYYAKTANPEVPYVFWLAVSMVFYLRLIRTPTVRDAAGFALAATLSICTKDQAYGLYILTPFPLVYRLWEGHRDAGDRHALRRALFDPRLWIPFATAVAVFALVHNIPFNPGGFLAHVRDITGAGQEGYQMVDASWTGRLSLLRIVADLNQRSWGWPFWLVAIAGLCVAAWDRSTRRATIVLVIFAASYYLGFINIIRYAFDRYLLPVCLIEALFIGVAFDRLLIAAAPARTAAARALVAAVFAYTALYAVTVDYLMVRDARYAAEQWLRSHDTAHRLVGFMFPATVLPRLQEFSVAEIKDVSTLRSAQPEFFLLNADYARAVPADRPEAQLAAGLQHGTVGYQLVFRFRTPVPWSWLPSPHPNLVGPRAETPVLSVLTEVNPTIEIYQRDGPANGR